MIPIQNSELNSHTQKKVLCRNKTPILPKRISYFELDSANVQKIIMMLGKKGLRAIGAVPNCGELHQKTLFCSQMACQS